MTNMFAISRQLWRQLNALNRIWWHCNNVLPIALNPEWNDSYYGETDPEKLVSNYEWHIKHLGDTDASEVRRFIKEYIVRINSGDKTSNKFSQQMEAIHSRIDKELIDMPDGIDKARGFLVSLLDIQDYRYDIEYDIACTFSEYVTADDVVRVAASWKRELREHLEKHRQRQKSAAANGIRDSYINHIFWTSFDVEGKLDAVSRLRFMDTFRLSEFPETRREILDFFPLEDMDEHDLWLIARCPSMVIELQQEISLVLKRLMEEFRYDGWLPSPYFFDYASSDFLPSVTRTALACNAILRMSSDPRKRDTANRGVQWLISQQHETGAWRIQVIRQDDLVFEPSIFATLIALLAISASEVDGYFASKTLGENWAREQQEDNGCWPDARPLSYQEMTLYWTEYFDELPGVHYTYSIDGPQSTLKPRLHIDDIDSFSKVRSVQAEDVEPYLTNGYLDKSEDEVQIALEAILNVQHHKKDWGGELNDLYTANVVFQGKRLQTAFLLKGNGLRQRKMEIRHCGSNGDQLLRLFRSSADLFVVQFVGEISENVIADVESKVALRRLQGNQTHYCISMGRIRHVCCLRTSSLLKWIFAAKPSVRPKCADLPA